MSAMRFRRGRMRTKRTSGFTLIELMIVLIVIGILAAIAYPSYTAQVVRSSREAAKAELLQLANLQEKIYLNSSAYSNNMTIAYNGRSDGGLGKTSGLTDDGKYDLSVVAGGGQAQTYTITATPRSGLTQAADGNLTITSDGSRTWGTKTW